MAVIDRSPRLYFSKSWLFTLSLTLCRTTLVSTACAPPPIPVGVGNVTLSNGNIARGLKLSVGSPPQPFAFMPQWPLNNTFLYAANGFCSDRDFSDTACITFHGGQYDDLSSKTRQVAPTGSFPDDSGTTGVGNIARTFPECTYITENFQLNSNSSLEEFPLGIALANSDGEQPYHAQMAVGLGENSTILHTLKNSGQIASRSWSMYWGRTGATPNTQQDGSFIFGGYDRAKVTGKNFTQPLSSANAQCASNLLVTITDITVNFPNGTDKSVMSDGFEPAEPLDACILPDYPTLLTIPYEPYYTNFADITDGYTQDRTFGLYYFGMLYDTVEPFHGDLSFTLSSGITIRVPNDQLVVPNVILDQKSGAWVANASEPELILNSNQAFNLDDLPQLGRQFLSAAYLLVNQDAASFTLWEANPTLNEDFVAIDTENKAIEEFCVSSATSSASSPRTTSPTSSTPSTSSTSSPTVPNSDSSTDGGPSVSKNVSKKALGGGPIAGIVIGSLALVAAAIALAFFIRRRKAAKTTARPHEVASDTIYRQYMPPEMDAKWTPAELSPFQEANPPSELSNTHARRKPLPRPSELA